MRKEGLFIISVLVLSIVYSGYVLGQAPEVIGKAQGEGAFDVGQSKDRFVPRWGPLEDTPEMAAFKAEYDKFSGELTTCSSRNDKESTRSKCAKKFGPSINELAGKIQGLRTKYDEESKLKADEIHETYNAQIAARKKALDSEYLKLDEQYQQEFSACEQRGVCGNCGDVCFAGKNWNIGSRKLMDSYLSGNERVNFERYTALFNLQLSGKRKTLAIEKLRESLPKDLDAIHYCYSMDNLHPASYGDCVREQTSEWEMDSSRATEFYFEENYLKIEERKVYSQVAIPFDEPIYSFDKGFYEEVGGLKLIRGKPITVNTANLARLISMAPKKRQGSAFTDTQPTAKIDSNSLKLAKSKFQESKNDEGRPKQPILQLGDIGPKLKKVGILSNFDQKNFAESFEQLPAEDKGKVTVLLRKEIEEKLKIKDVPSLTKEGASDVTLPGERTTPIGSVIEVLKIENDLSFAQRASRLFTRSRQISESGEAV